ncbi:MAG: phosphotransferase family protein [Acidimicrobiaceae bacterium]|nr:phosphotransferase family protein [Acidimicrobiaceae bacterium]
MSDDQTPGYDIPAIEEWLSSQLSSLVAPYVWTKLEGGHSNLTYRIDGADGAKSAVIRRPPMGKLLPKAHDMGREWACISALWGRVPVAEPLAFCESPDVTGAHFYVMGLVDAKAMYGRADVEAWIPAENRVKAAESWIDALAALHSLDIDEIGLGDLGRRDGYIERQMKTWYRSWTSSVKAAQIDDQRIHDLYDALIAGMPEPGPTTVVHGDYGTHNVMFDADSTVAAVVDWEIATLGDPMADLGYAMNAWAEPGDPVIDKSEATSLAEGFPSRQHLIDRYATATGRDVSALPYYRAFNRFKLTCILHGVYARYRRGQKMIEPDELEEMRQRTFGLIESAAADAEHL